MSEQSAYQTLIELLHKKAENEKKLSVEVLNTRYKKSYDQLKKEICAALGEVLPQFIFSGIRFMPGDDEQALAINNKIRLIIDEEVTGGIFKKLRNIAFETCDADKVLAAAVPLRNRVIYEAYADYWVSKCKKVTVPGYSHYNEIIKMWYSLESKNWVAEENGKVSFACYYPPTRELIDAEYEIEKKTA